MTERTVVARLVLDLTGYTPATVEASKSTSALATAQKEAADSAKAAGVAQTEAGAAAKEASAAASASAQEMKAAQTEAAAAAKEASATQVAASQATTDAERIEAEAVAATAAERSTAAKEALTTAQGQAEADAQAAAAAKAGASEASKYAVAQRDVAAAAKEAATAESTAAKESAAATAERTQAYKESSTAMSTMGLVTVAAAGLMVKSAGDFQSATQHFVTDAGESQANLGMVQAGILKTATDTGTSTTALTDAMYHIESAGFHGADGLNVLTVAAEGAKVGGADLGTVAKTLTGTMNSYNLSISQSVPVMNELIATVAAGDMKMNDLASSLGSVAPKAAAAGISLAQVGGAIATMTSQNMSADQATQDLSSTISSLQNPNNVAIQQMQQLGLSSNDVSMNLGKEGLTGTLQTLTTAILSHTQNGQVFIDTLKSSQNAAADANTMLAQLPPSIQNISKQLLDGSISAAQYKKATTDLSAPQQHLAQQFDQLVKSSGGFNSLLTANKPLAETFSAALSNMLGGTTGLNTALMLTGGRMATFQANVATVQDAANKGGTAVDNWDKIQATFNQKIDIAKASIGAMGIAIGTTLLPVVADIAKAVTSVVTPIAEWVDKNQTLTAVVLGSAAALAALVISINLIIKGGQLVKTAYDGVKTAIDLFGKSADTAAAKSDALAASQSAAAVKTDVAAASASAATVKVEALGVASAQTAVESDAAAASTGGMTGKLSASLPIIGAVALGAEALGGWLDKLGKSGAQAGQSIDQWTTTLLNGNASSKAFGLTADQAQKALDAMGGKANSAIEPVAALGAVLARSSQSQSNQSDMVKTYDAALATMVSSGNATRAAALVAQITSATNLQGKALVDTQRDFPQYFAAVDKAAANQALAANAAKTSTTALGDNTTALGANAAAATAGATANAAAADGTTAATTAVSAQATILFQAGGASRALAEAFAASTDKTLAGTDATKAAIATHKLAVTALQATADAENSTADAALGLDSSVTDEVTAMKAAQTSAGTLSDALNALNGVHISASKAAVDEQQKIADLTTAFGANGKTLDITTTKGRANITAIDDMATAANAHAQAVTAESGSIDAGNKALDESRAQFDAVLKSAGLSTDQIDDFNRTLLATPKETKIVLAVSADTSAANSALQALENKYAGTGIVFGGGPGGKRIIPAMATGGQVVGVGSGTSDSNMIAASAGEYMVKASVVQQPGMLAALNSLNFGTGSASVVKPQIPLYGLGPGAPGGGSNSMLQAIEQALTARPAADNSAPLAVFNYSGTQAPTPEQQAIMMRHLASAVAG